MNLKIGDEVYFFGNETQEVYGTIKGFWADETEFLMAIVKLDRQFHSEEMPSQNFILIDYKSLKTLS